MYKNSQYNDKMDVSPYPDKNLEAVSLYRFCLLIMSSSAIDLVAVLV